MRSDGVMVPASNRQSDGDDLERLIDQRARVAIISYGAWGCSKAQHFSSQVCDKQKAGILSSEYVAS